MHNRYVAAGLVAASASFACLSPAHAQEPEARLAVRIPAAPLERSLREVATRFGRTIAAESNVLEGWSAPAIEGEFTFDEVMARLLAGTDLEAVSVAGGTAVRPRSPADQQAVPSHPAIVVTGSRIRGAPVASTIIAIDREAMRDAGQQSLAEVFRTIPQNFGGGQNPGIGYNVPEGNGADVGGGSSVNLRGLGSDATLTLLDGHRLSYDAAAQAVDISAIPFGAIERLDIVPDGASALFGSDAVAGVVNIVLRKDFSGLETSARIGASTDGGNFQQQYDATAGRRWASGSALLSYEFARTTEIKAEDRSYAAQRSPGLTLFPFLRHHNAAGTVRQEIGDDLQFELIALYNTRTKHQSVALNAAGDLSESRLESAESAQSWAIAPSVALKAGRDWRIELSGSYGWNRVRYGGTYVFSGTPSDAGSGSYRNITWNGEISADGSLFALPAGPVGLAAGAGFRRNEFARISTRGASNFVDEAQDSYFAFAELSIPLIADDDETGIGGPLDLSLAARYERYPGIGSVTTPKLGFVYSVTSDLTLKASWGRSFRAATLYEQYSPTLAYLESASRYGGDSTGGATVLFLSGGNPDLKPERSRNWSAGILLHPVAVPNLELDLSYFDVDYRDRIVTPIDYASRSLSDPLYADRLTYNPSENQINAALTRAVIFNVLTGTGFDPALISAIIDNTNVNAASQTARGVDASLRYHSAVGSGTLSASLFASYLTSSQTLGTGRPEQELAGQLFNPPHFRGRGELGWRTGPFNVTAALTYIGPVEDNRAAQAERIVGMMPIDLTLRYRPSSRLTVLSGIDISVSASNIFNDKPSLLSGSSNTSAPYDSTNYSPFGRMLTLSVTKSW